MNEDQVNDMIQTWRDTPEKDLTPDDFQWFKNLGCACVTGGDCAQLLKCIQDEKNQEIVKSMGCVLLEPLINGIVKKEKGLYHCQAAITYLTQTCRADELLQSLLGLIEDIHPGAISETIMRQLSRLPVPYTQQQEEADEFGLCRCYSALAEFTKSIVEEMKRKDGDCDTAEDEELRTELLKFCLRSLRDPLLEAELNRDRKSSLWLFAMEIMVTLPVIQVSLSELLFFNSPKKSPLADNSQLNEARACLAYLLFVQRINIDSFPAVYSPVFILRCNVEYISQLLSSKKESHLLKGLALFTKSLQSVQDNALPVSLLELKSFYSAIQNLRQLLTECPLQHLRTSGLQVLQLFINKLDPEAKHKFFRCMLKTGNHAGVESYVVKNIKNQVEVSMEPGNHNKWFLGEEFLSLLGLVLCFPQGAETDLLHSMDRIMESLNLLRFLLIKDKVLWSQTDVWEELVRIKDEYLKMLRVCISMSRAYYSAELKALREDLKLKVKEARESARSSTLVKRITVKHQDVSNMSPEVKHQVLQSALVTFDLMESLIFRIEEIAEEKRKIPN
ncbi:unnamed protein product [Pleuronectes platessa]|uniref:Glomulin n=1 Tax=Pleuronectes platessa TaxID=8262 RepID=A0A9N7UWZ1_PLEPL|nr:unnamed protein product [Pleuronectes platessa]